MNANGLFSDMIHHKTTLSIPITGNFRYKAQEKITEEEAFRQEQARREQTVLMVSQHIQEVQGRPGANFRAEALFYCEENGYDYRKAMKAYDEDKAFEDE